MFVVFNNIECGFLLNGCGLLLDEVIVGVYGLFRMIEVFWLILGFGVFVLMLVVGFSVIWKYIYKDKVSSLYY